MILFILGILTGLVIMGLVLFVMIVWPYFKSQPDLEDRY